MTDTRTPEQRRRIMSAVRQRDTKPEVALRRRLHARGLRGWRCNYRGAVGYPDVAWVGVRVAVFVDGAFWHGHPSRHKPGRSGAYWDQKIAANVARDRRVDFELRTAGWEVVRLWDFEVHRDLDRCVDRVLEALDGWAGHRRPLWLQGLVGSAKRTERRIGVLEPPALDSPVPTISPVPPSPDRASGGMRCSGGGFAAGGVSSAA